jgi:hypothetical protein
MAVLRALYPELNDPAQQRRGPSELHVMESLHAPAVCCSAWDGPQTPTYYRHPNALFWRMKTITNFLFENGANTILIPTV